MIDFAPLTPQPAATRDGVGLDPLAGGFLPPYAERLDLIRPFPALSAEAMGAALLDDGADAGGTRDDGPDSGGRAAGAPFGGYKTSGIGRETHKMMLAAYTQVKNIYISTREEREGMY